jgi:hypothetical protein
VGAIAGIVISAVYFASSREPSYQGKSLSAWIAPFCRQTPTGWYAPAGPQHFEELQPVRRAVSQIGTNALPFLIARLDHREGSFLRMVRQLANKQPFPSLKLTDPRVSRIRAIRALAILGPAAQPAVPSLASQLTDPSLSEHAVYALSGMGPGGMRALIDQFANVGPAGRMQIARTLISPASTYRGEDVNRLQANQIPVDIMVDGLSLMAQDQASAFRIPAIQRLGTLGLAASNAVPGLLPMVNDPNPMTRHMAMRALGEIKARPELVVPALTNLLSNPDPGTRMAATLALRAFGYTAPFQPGMPERSLMPGQPYLPERTNRLGPGDRSKTPAPHINSP